MYWLIGFIFGFIVADFYFNDGKTVKYVITKIIDSVKNVKKDIEEHINSKEK